MINDDWFQSLGFMTVQKCKGFHIEISSMDRSDIFNNFLLHTTTF